MKQVLSRWRWMLAAVVSVLALTYASHRWLQVDATVAAIVLLLVVLLTGLYAELPQAVASAVVATVCLDYFYIPPVGSITVADPQGWILLMVFLAVSLIATNLSTKLRNQRDELIAQQKEAEKLHALSRSILFSESAEDIPRLLVNKCAELFRLPGVVLYESAKERFYRAGDDHSIPEESLRSAASRSFVESSEADQLTVASVALGNKLLGSVAFRGAQFRRGTLQALANTLALGIAQAQAREDASRAEAVRKSEELKSVMIDALAHDLKTPLTSIEAAADLLLQPATLSSEQEHDLLEVVQEEAKGLRRLVGEAIHLARIDAKKLKLDCQPVSVDALIEAAIVSLPDRVAARRIDVLLADVPAVSADKELITQALKQLLDNSLKYSPPRESIKVSASAENGLVTIMVRDTGQGLTELEQSRVFDKFYRGRYDRSAVQGTGMGLSITKEILEAHGGSAGVRSQRGEGTEFFITLHAAADSQVMVPKLV